MRKTLQPKDMLEGTIHKTKRNGSLTIVSYLSYESVLVRFIDTGYEVFTSSGDIRKGNVRDKMIPTICGVGFLGGDYYKSSDKGFDMVCYDAWCNMLKRCYTTTPRDLTYFDCEVCEEWQNFQNFAEWFHHNHPNDGKHYHLDKDIRCPGSRIYNPETCSIVSREENIREMNDRTRTSSYVLISPDGDLFEMVNMSEFSRNNYLSQSGLSNLVNGKIKAHKGWTLAK